MRCSNETTIQIKKSTTCLTVVAAILIALAGLPAVAGVGGSATPSFPGTVNVGDTNVVPTSLALAPILSDDDAAGEALITDIKLNPACKNAACTLFETPGTVLTLNGPISTSGTCTDAADATVTFALSGPDATGHYTFTPSAPLQIASAEVCTINFEIDAVGVPTFDAGGAAGIQTIQHGEMTVTAIATNNVGAGVGTELGGQSHHPV